MFSATPLDLRSVLDNSGVMNDLRAKLRTEVFHALDDKVSCYFNFWYKARQSYFRVSQARGAPCQILKNKNFLSRKRNAAPPSHTHTHTLTKWHSKHQPSMSNTTRVTLMSTTIGMLYQRYSLNCLNNGNNSHSGLLLTNEDPECRPYKSCIWPATLCKVMMSSAAKLTYLYKINFSLPSRN